VCRYLKTQYGYTNDKLKYAAYLLVTYAIEVRADELYPKYQEVLSETGSRVNVKNIISEEEKHLAEMISQLKTFSPDWEKIIHDVSTIENELFEEWLKEIQKEMQDIPTLN